MTKLNLDQPLFSYVSNPIDKLIYLCSKERRNRATRLHNEDEEGWGDGANPEDVYAMPEARKWAPRRSSLIVFRRWTYLRWHNLLMAFSFPGFGPSCCAL